MFNLIGLLKFGTVGILGMIPDFLITWLLKEKLLADKLLSNSAGFITAVLCNYYLNRNWTFNSNGEISKEIGLFLIISSIGLALNNLILLFLIKKIRFNFYYSKVLAIAIVFCWNFMANTLFTFQHG